MAQVCVHLRVRVRVRRVRAGVGVGVGVGVRFAWGGALLAPLLPMHVHACVSCTGSRRRSHMCPHSLLAAHILCAWLT